MAENENIQLVKDIVADLNAHRVDAYLQKLDEGYIGESELAPGPVRGREGARQMLEMQFRAFPDLRVEPEQILASGDHVIGRARITATHKGNFAGIPPTNKTVSWLACNVIEIRNGKVVRTRIYADNALLLEQLGAISIPRAKAAG